MKWIVIPLLILSTFSVVSSASPASIDNTIELALHGDASAQFDLALSYDFGDGIKQDIGKAIKWYQASAMQGLEEAQVAMAMYYEIGKGVKQDINESAKWYTKAASQGSLVAQLAIAKFYQDGKGVKKDKLIACAWYLLAAESGDAEARRASLEFAETLDDRELQMAERLKETYKSRMVIIQNNRRA